MARTILLADDSVTIRRVVELTFGGTDIRVETAASGKEALAQFRSVKPDLVLADVIMPPPSGYDLCRAVKDSGTPVPVLLLAGAFEPYDEKLAHECGADGHLIKPFESEYLVSRVNAILSEMPLSTEAVPTASEEEMTSEADRIFDDLVRADDDSEQHPPLVEEEQQPVAVPGAESEGSDVVPDRSGDIEAPAAFGEEDLERLARAVVSRLSEETIREIAWEVVPELAETLIRERIRQIEEDDDRLV